MSCVKCGRKTEGTDAFCPECLAGMKDYPVKPGTKAHIPVRPELPERKPAKVRKEKSSEEQITGLQKTVKRLIALAAALAVGLALAIGALVVQLMGEAPEETPDQPRSRNYTTSATEEP